MNVNKYFTQHTTRHEYLTMRAHARQWLAMYRSWLKKEWNSAVQPPALVAEYQTLFTIDRSASGCVGDWNKYLRILWKKRSTGCTPCYDDIPF